MPLHSHAGNLTKSNGEYEERRFAMLLKSEWAERFINTCAKVKSARRRVLAAGDQGMKTKQVADVFQVSRSWVR